ncbi:MAG: TaqI family restriction endonuclease [Elusimicrobiaceae bacterium]|uniref:TaqI family restriction endonuclease n=1 Tax=Candidatus Avelusimicrobium faecicola TaxID=3416205 RepID=UPI002A7922F9|nr:TaqI family restriction endonuclease [Spirochaetota bacterium]MDY2940663.1 TaqI family restriction endonuclease [Elusimicrobiaceae bacterium]
MAKFTLAQFEDFLSKIDLNSYRERFQSIKTVEMDLIMPKPHNIQALKTIYEQYWKNKDNRTNPPMFDEYYDIYYKENEQDILLFWHNTGFGTNCNCFQKGLKARIYRTWASLITQIQGGYVAESVFGKGSVRMGTELDHKNVDILIVNSDGSDKLKIQIKKETHRPEIARMQKNNQSADGIVDVYYIVVSQKDYDNPYYKRNGKKYKIGDEKPFVKDFIKWYPETGTMNRLSNGFTIFTKNAFIYLK